MRDIRITQIDGSLPNLALMRLASFHRAQGDSVHFSRDVCRTLFEPEKYHVVYGSSIFNSSSRLIERFLMNFPGAVIGGTGSGNILPVEEVIGQEWNRCDYSDYPDFTASLGFTQRGCRMRCQFCVVPSREGVPRSVCSIPDIWRGPGWPRKIHLLDNDFFGQTTWQDRIAELQKGDFRVCFGQGINIRLLNDEQAQALASVQYRDVKFSRRKIYTAWDRPKDEGAFFKGVDRLEKAGIPPSHLRAYMLVGFDQSETWPGLMYRFRRMVNRGIEPYPMVFNSSHKNLKAFQRWAVTGLYRAVPWEQYRSGGR